MYNISYSMIFLILLTVAISIFYFYLFINSKEKYIRFWGLSWTMYAISLVFDTFLIHNPQEIVFLGIKQIVDLFGSLFLLFGTYVFTEETIPNHWIQFSLLVLIWIITAIFSNVTFITLTLIPAIYLGVIAIVTGITLLRYWELNSIQKVITGTMFFFWGIHKAYYPYFNPEYWNSPTGYLSEIILTNILNFCILLIYLQKIRNELNHSEKRYRLLAENAQDLIYYYRLIPSSGFEYISPSCISTIGYTPENFYSDPNFFKKLTHPEDVDQLEEILSRNISSPLPVTLRWIHKNGHSIWTEQKNTYIYNGDGNVCGIEGIVRDITDRKLAEDSMLQAKRSRQLLLSYISHELRTPITSILGYVSAMKDGSISENLSVSHCLDLIYSKSLMLNRLIQDLFQLSQLESKQFSFNFTQINASKLIKDIIKKHEWDIANTGIQLELALENLDENVEVLVDIERFSQVISNLITNSLNNTPYGGIISLSCEVATDSFENICIKLSDTGNGIRPEDLPFIFERFYTGKKKDSLVPTGTGLGLTISKEIVESHNGNIWVESTLNKGTSFFITLPIFNEVS